MLVRSQMHGIERQLFNKANEVQEDISLKKFQIRLSIMQLGAVKAQVRTFLHPFRAYQHFV